MLVLENVFVDGAGAPHLRLDVANYAASPAAVAGIVRAAKASWPILLTILAIWEGEQRRSELRYSGESRREGGRKFQWMRGAAPQLDASRTAAARIRNARLLAKHAKPVKRSPMAAIAKLKEHAVMTGAVVKVPGTKNIYVPRKEAEVRGIPAPAQVRNVHGVWTEVSPASGGESHPLAYVPGTAVAGSYVERAVSALTGAEPTLASPDPQGVIRGGSAPLAPGFSAPVEPAPVPWPQGVVAPQPGGVIVSVPEQTSPYMGPAPYGTVFQPEFTAAPSWLPADPYVGYGAERGPGWPPIAIPNDPYSQEVEEWPYEYESFEYEPEWEEEESWSGLPSWVYESDRRLRDERNDIQYFKLGNLLKGVVKGVAGILPAAVGLPGLAPIATGVASAITGPSKVERVGQAVIEGLTGGKRGGLTVAQIARQGLEIFNSAGPYEAVTYMLAAHPPAYELVEEMRRLAATQPAARVTAKDGCAPCDKGNGPSWYGELPTGVFFESDLVKASIKRTLGDEVYGQVDLGHLPFKVDISGNHGGARAGIALAHELAHVADKLYKLGLSHDKVHDLGVFYATQGFPAWAAFRRHLGTK